MEPPKTTSPPATYLTSYAAIRACTNQLLEEYFNQQIRQAEQLSPQYAALWQAMWRLVQAGGKRLRPYIFILAYEACARQTATNDIQQAAVSFELLHQALLIHDDIVDQDYIRYGQANVAGQYQQLYKQQLGLTPAAAARLADDAALLAGDCLLSGCYQTLGQSGLPAQAVNELSRRLGQAAFAVLGGELLDIEAPYQPIEAADPLLITRLKTAAYSFQLPLAAGAHLAGAKTSTVSLFEALGEQLGIAFGLADDLLGVFGDPNQTGKSATSDLAEGKRTLLLQQTYAQASPKQRSKLEQLIGKHDLNEAEAAQIRKIIEQTGSRKFCQQIIRQHADVARRSLHQLALEPPAQAQFLELIERASQRSS